MTVEANVEMLKEIMGQVALSPKGNVDSVVTIKGLANIFTRHQTLGKPCSLSQKIKIKIK